MSKDDGNIWSKHQGRDIVAPEPTERDFETHPAWVLIGASRVSVSPPGATLFDSDIRHGHTVMVRLKRAERKRDLNHDWIMGREELFEIEMSEAQWASFVSSMNTGDGVPATLKFDATQDPEGRMVPGMPYAPRLQESMNEVRDAGEKAVEQIHAAFDAYKEHKTVGNLRHLEAMIDNLPGNLTFAAKSLSEHAENVVQRARADIESYVVGKARQLGIEPGDLGESPLEIGPGDGEETS